MSGAGGTMQAVTSLLLAVGIELPPWGMPAIALAIMILLLPFLLKNMKTSRARKLLKRASLQGAQRRVEMEREALSLVASNPTGRLALADECIRRGRYALARELLSQLPDTPKLRRERRRLLQQMAPHEPATAEGAAAAIEHLLEEGLHDEAHRRLEAARRRWPEDASLSALVGA